MASDETAREFGQVAFELLSKALGTMNEAVRLTAEEGPSVGMEWIADYLNNTDGVDDEIADTLPTDWLTRWSVTSKNDPLDSTPAGQNNGSPT